MTPIQLATAYAAMVNGGRLVQPHVVKAIGNQRGPDLDRRRSPVEEAVQAAHAAHGPRRDHGAVLRDRTLIPGYHVGGKTGTAQIWDPKANKGRGAWKHNKFNYTFVGYVAREKGRPDLVVAVRIEEGTPTTLRVGQIEMPVMSFALFRRIAHAAITTPDLLTLRDANLQATPAPSAP